MSRLSKLIRELCQQLTSSLFAHKTPFQLCFPSCLAISILSSAPISISITLAAPEVSLAALPLNLTFAYSIALVTRPTLRNGLINVTHLLYVSSASDSRWAVFDSTAIALLWRFLSLLTDARYHFQAQENAISPLLVEDSTRKYRFLLRANSQICTDCTGGSSKLD